MNQSKEKNGHPWQDIHNFMRRKLGILNIGANLTGAAVGESFLDAGAKTWTAISN
ncbi:MAG: hypothetical protein PVF56_06035 [Desulfobacterales bacterium]|jgi:hypothetical protein